VKRNAVETVMGAVVLVVAALFLFFAYTTSQVSAVSGYDLTARFSRVSGLRDGGDVRISGIKVGSIISQQLDPKTFVAIVKMSIEPSIQLPVDTVATITSSGLFGDEYLSLEPGNEDQMIKPGGEIDHTQPPMDLESLIGQYIFSSQPGKGGGPGAGAGGLPAPGAAAPGAGAPAADNGQLPPAK
jgi:phospholipid/cholesterol/gamma-HCH transport system substrate-binding protein